MMPRTILHLDLDAFFCAVEEQRDASLHGLPFAVGGRPDQRGVVASCSYAARKFGVHSAMPMSRALALCPDLVIVPHRHKDYGAVSRKVMAYLHTVTPQVEQISIDEAFLDVTGLRLGGRKLAQQLQTRLNSELALPCSLGVATNKLVAKIANNVGKVEASAQTDGPPNAIKVVPPGEEAAFLAPLPIRELWGVGPKTAEKLHRIGVQTIGELAQQPEATLVRMFGKTGADLAQRSKGIDTRPVETEQVTKSISSEITFARDVRDEGTLRRTLRRLSDQVAFRTRRADLSGRTVSIKLRWSDFTTVTRQVTLPHPVNQDSEVYASALALFERYWVRGRPVRLIGVAISGFDAPLRQLSLWEAAPREQQHDLRLQSTLDALKNRFGESVIKRGSTLNRDDETPHDDS
jgi:DNA polymerase-4